MHLFQDMFDEVIKEQLSFPVLAARFLRKKMEEEGVSPTDDQIAYIKAIFEQLEKDKLLSSSLSIIFNDDGSISTLLDQNNGENIIDLTEIADNEIDKLLAKLPELINGIAVELGNYLLRALTDDSRHILRERTLAQQKFEKRLYRKWKKPFRLMEFFIIIAEEIGSDYNHYISTTIDISRAYKFEVLRRLHARSCQVAKEILTLLKSGFADGADARWRTLHEISVISNFITHHSDALAEKYLLHEIIERYQFACVYQDHSDVLGFERVDDQEMESLRIQAQEIINRFGPEFKNDYGWAVEVLGKKKPTFYDLESEIAMGHYRPFYKFACINVHAGPRGIIYRLGLAEKDLNNILLSGSSDIGLIDPGQNMVYSLMIATTSFLLYQVNIDCLVAINILSKLQSEFLAVIDQYQY
jgi:hypothetical protein